MLLPMLMGALGAGAGYVRVPSITAFGTGTYTTPAAAYGGFKFKVDGRIDKVNTAGTFSWNSPNIDNWYSRSASGMDLSADYEIEVTATGDTGDMTGPVGWTNVSGEWFAPSDGTTCAWYITDTTLIPNTKLATLTVRIRDTATSTVLATGTMTISAAYEET